MDNKKYILAFSFLLLFNFLIASITYQYFTRGEIDLKNLAELTVPTNSFELEISHRGRNSQYNLWVESKKYVLYNKYLSDSQKKEIEESMIHNKEITVITSGEFIVGIISKDQTILDPQTYKSQENQSSGLTFYFAVLLQALGILFFVVVVKKYRKEL